MTPDVSIEGRGRALYIALMSWGAGWWGGLTILPSHFGHDLPILWEVPGVVVFLIGGLVAWIVDGGSDGTEQGEGLSADGT